MEALKPILQVAEEFGIAAAAVEPYGRFKAKINPAAVEGDRKGKLIMVTAITPNKAGIGKTVNTIGLSMGINRHGKKAVAVLREPSLGPCFGMKGGAAGGGNSRLEPSVDINLHFNGDFHAITSANNILAALLENHLYHTRAAGQWKAVYWKRVLDVNDRSLRHVITGLGGTSHGVPREAGFDITPASEIMALLCLATDYNDLLTRINRIVLGKDQTGKEVTVGDLQFGDAIAVLLKDAIHPNLVQTCEGTPALIHGGPFANIAHGCNSLIATQLGLRLAEYAVTEAGFGSDLGAEKFYDIKCRIGGLKPSVSVLMCSLQALKLHGGASEAEMQKPDAAALARGMENLSRHLDILSQFGPPVAVGINCFPWDTQEELDYVRNWVIERGFAAEVTRCFADGGAGSFDLAAQVIRLAEAAEAQTPNFTYTAEMRITEKVDAIVKKIYKGRKAVFSDSALKKAAEIEKAGLGHLPVCIAKTQYSFSADTSLGPVPTDFDLPVREVVLNAGAGFIVAIAGEIMRMPGLPKVPQAVNIRMENGVVYGVE